MAKWARSYSSLKGISQICEIVRDFLFLDFSFYDNNAIEVWKYIVFFYTLAEKMRV